MKAQTVADKMLELAKYNKILEQHPNNHPTMGLKAITLMKIGRLDEAIDLFGQAISLDPRDASYYVGRGEALYLSNKKELANNDYEQARVLVANTSHNYDNFERRYVFTKIAEYDNKCAQDSTETDQQNMSHETDALGKIEMAWDEVI